MSAESEALLDRAAEALRMARFGLEVSPDGAANRAYYAAFHAASALFAAEGRTFRKHSALEAAVHRDLVRTGRWTEKLGEDYSRLARLRGTADYGAALRVTQDAAADAVRAAERILAAVSAALGHGLPP